MFLKELLKLRGVSGNEGEVRAFILENARPLADRVLVLRYLPVGSVDPAVCVSKRVLVGPDLVPGVLGSKAVHLQEPEERTHPFTHDNLFIDIGAKDKKEAPRMI